MYKSCNVVMLSTNEKASIIKGENVNYLIIPEEWSGKGIPQHLYITSNDEIKEDDWFLYLSSEIPIVYRCGKIDSTFERQRDECRKIIAGIPKLPIVDLSDLKEEDCKTIGWVDAEKLAKNYIIDWEFEKILGSGSAGLAFDSFVFGFITAQSLNDKKFSLEDMEEYLKVYRIHIEADFESKHKWVQTPSEFIQSVQQTVWEVEVEMENNLIIKEESDSFNYDNGQKINTKYGQPKVTNNSIKITKIL